MRDMLGVEGILTANILIGAVFYGMHIMTFFTVAYLSFRNKKQSNAIPSWVLIPAFALMVLGTAHFVGSTVFYFKSWKYGYTDGRGPIDWMRENYGDRANLLARGSSTIVYLVQDTVLLHRVYIVYTLFRFRAIVVAVSAIGICWAFVFSLFSFMNAAWPAETRWIQNIGSLRILHCSFAAGVSFAMTAAVVVRMLYQRRRVIKYLGREHARVYTSAAAVFVESNALFSMFTIVCAIPGTHIIGPTYFSFANYSMVHAAGISTGLLAIRAAFGRAWVETTAEPTEPIRFSTNSSATHTMQSRV